MKLNKGRSGLKQQVMGLGMTAVALLTTLQPPISAGTPPTEPPLNPKFDPLHLPEPGGKGANPKVRFGLEDAWVAKYQVGPDGVRKMLWKKQLGTSTNDSSSGVATDSSGNVLISGGTHGALEGSNQGYYDAWVAKYSPAGALLWTKQLGTSTVDYSNGVATDSSGNVFISGFTQGALGGSKKGGTDAWVAKYSTDGALLWTKQLGTSDYDYSNGVATDSSGNVFISGTTDGALEGTNKGSRDAWVAKYSPDGALLWIKQLGTSNYDYSYGVASDSIGNVLISGFTFGALGGSNQGRSDAWVAKYSPDGALLWKKQLGTSDADYSLGVATDSSGNVFISGFTFGALGGTNKGRSDAWVAKFNTHGKQLWLRQDGTKNYDDSTGVATDGSGNMLVTGFTRGNFGKP